MRVVVTRQGWGLDVSPMVFSIVLPYLLGLIGR
jgi:hypothetical protein